MIIEAVSNSDASLFLQRPEFIDSITDDYSPRVFTVPTYVSCVGWRDRGQLIALFCYHPYRDGYKLHFHVMPNYRRSHARILGRLALLDRFRPIYVETATKYQSVINFVLKFGFKTIEINPKSYLKNGQLFDKHLMVWL